MRDKQRIKAQTYNYYEKREYPRDKCIHELFEEQVKYSSNKIAIIFKDQYLTYQSLNSQANQLAFHLRKNGIKSDILVGIYMDRSLEMIVAMLAVLKAGGAYVPLDTTYPSHRLSVIIEDTQISLILTQKHLLRLLSDYQGTIVPLDLENNNILSESNENLPSIVTPENLAYVIYTSGSTGIPKGVEIPHRGVVRLLFGVDYLPFHSLKSFIQLAPVSFDASIFEIWGALLHGAQCVLFPDRVPEIYKLEQVLSEHNIDCIWLTASLFNFIVDEKPQILKDVTYILTGGEALSVKHIRKAQEELPNCQLINGYGPTESTTFTCCYKIPNIIHKKLTSIPIGRPIANTQVYILNDEMVPVSNGESGELYIGGDGLARGYLNSPELTNQKFVHNPFKDNPSEKLYKSGDLCRYLPDSNIEFLGRVDNQIKIRGYRIEPGEIEYVIGQFPDINQVVVIIREDTIGDKRLVAYIITKTKKAFSQESLKQFLQEQLPEYMIPSAFAFIDSIPLTSNGKTNIKALPIPEVQNNNKRIILAPTSIFEKAITYIWHKALNIENISLDDNFFELGGHSLLATKVIYRISKEHNIYLPLQIIYDNPTIKLLAKVIEQYTKDATKKNSYSNIPSTPRNGPLPLSFAQQRLWFFNEFENNSSLYNIPFILRLTGILDIISLEQSLNEIIKRHESLRTTFDYQDSMPVQVIHPFVYEPLIIEDFSNFSENEIYTVLQRESSKVFDLKTGPLFIYKLYKLNSEKYILYINIHHIISDGWSMDVFFNELSVLYRTPIKSNALSTLTIQYADYAIWQRKYLQGEILENLLKYWNNKLGINPPILDFPTDYPRPSIQTYKGQKQSLIINKELSEALINFCKKGGKTLYMTLLAAFKVLLYRYCNQEDIIIGSPIANRTHIEIDQLIGFFVNIVVLRTDLSGNPTFLEVLDRVQRTSVDSYNHQEINFDKLIEELNVRREQNRSPLFQIMFVLQNAHEWQLNLEGIETIYEDIHTKTSKYDITLIIENRGTDLYAIIEYNSSLFFPETIDNLLRNYQVLLNGIIKNPESNISELPLTSDEEKNLIVNKWNDTKQEYPNDKCVQEIFEDQAKRTPDDIALIYKNEKLTYKSLNEEANKLASYLRNQSVKPDTLVGVYMDRSLEMIISFLAILKAGGAYVPMDPTYPKQRLAMMIEETKMPLILTQSYLQDSLPKHDAINILVDIEKNKYLHEPSVNLPILTTSDNLAYVMYTSGSTGKPKGVEIKHCGILRLLFGVDYVPFNAVKSFIQLAPASFDASTFEIWGALLYGAKCVLFPDCLPDLDKLEAILVRYKIDCMWLTASLFNFIVDERPKILENVSYILTGGEALSVKHIKKAQKELPNCQLINGYGPTESTTFTCCFKIPDILQRNLSSIPIGHPIANSKVYILDQYLKPVPIGVIGELHIGGDGLARGYLNSPELTQEKFIPNPFSNSINNKLYKTGDLSRYLPDGNIEFIGRKDQQIKIRGYRIEPGEIESEIRQISEANQVLVIGSESTSGEKRLIAYIVDNSNTLNIESIKQYLYSKLPEYMIPSAFMIIDKIPLTHNGKIDITALPEPDVFNHEMINDKSSLPLTPVQISISSIWANAMGIDTINIYNNFFELGGHSLMAVKIIFQINELYNCSLPLSTIFNASTIKKLSDIVEQGNNCSAKPTSIVLMKQGKSGPPIFFIPGGGGESLSLVHLAEQINMDRPIYGLERKGLYNKENPQRSIEEIASYFIEIIKGLQKNGPYYIVSYSLGGRIAYEMALQLKNRGDEINLLALVGASAPKYPILSTNFIIRKILSSYYFLRIPFTKKIECLNYVFSAFFKRINKLAIKTSTIHENSLLLNSKEFKQTRSAWIKYSPHICLLDNSLIIRERSMPHLYSSFNDYYWKWDKFIKGQITCHILDCEHGEIIQPPYVKQVADIIKSYIFKKEKKALKSIKLKNGELPTFNVLFKWDLLPQNLHLTENVIDIIALDLDKQPEIDLFNILSDDEKDQSNRFYHLLDKNRFIVRRGILRILLSKYLSQKPDQIIFRYDKNGKPELDKYFNNTSIEFNISSSKNFALFAISSNIKVGIDVEHVMPETKFLDIANQFFSKDEINMLNNASFDVIPEYFTALWTAKEAYIKANGIVSLNEFSISLSNVKAPIIQLNEKGTKWAFQNITMSKEVISTLAYNKLNCKIKYWKYN